MNNIELTKMLSGLMSACIMFAFRRRDNAMNSWWAYARTARMLRPTSLPNRFTTSRRFILKRGVKKCEGRWRWAVPE